MISRTTLFQLRLSRSLLGHEALSEHSVKYFWYSGEIDSNFLGTSLATNYISLKTDSQSVKIVRLIQYCKLWKIFNHFKRMHKKLIRVPTDFHKTYSNPWISFKPIKPLHLDLDSRGSQIYLSSKVLALSLCLAPLRMKRLVPTVYVCYWKLYASNLKRWSYYALCYVLWKCGRIPIIAHYCFACT